MTIAKEPDSPMRISEDIVLPTKEIYSDEPQFESFLHLNQIILPLIGTTYQGSYDPE